MKKSIQSLIVLACLAVLAAGCASAPSKFYTLNATAKAEGTPAAQYSVSVGPVAVPAAVDRPQFTVQVSPNRVALDEFNRWAEPLNDTVAQVVAANLSALLGTPRVTSSALANFNADYQVSLNLQRFESVPGKSVTVAAIWVVKPAHGVAISGQTVAEEPVTDSSYDALAAAHSQALAKVSGEIAAAIRTAAAQ